MKKHLISERNEVKIGKDGALLSISKVLSLSISMVTSMLLARFRTLTEYGTFSEIATVVSLAISVLCIGLPNCINFFVPRCETQKERDQFLTFYYSVNTLLGTLTGIILLISTPIIVKYYDNPNIITFSYALALLPWCQIISKSRENLLVATQQSKRAIIINLLNALSNLGIILLTQILNQNFEFFFLLYIADNVLFGFIVFFEAYRLIEKIDFSIGKSFIREIFKYSIPIGIASAVATIDLDLDKLIIGLFFTTEEVAIYANCGKELPIIYIASSFSSVLLPIVVKKVKDKDYSGAIDLWKDTVEFSALITFFFVTAMVVFAPQIVSLLYSNKYLPGVAIFRIYALVLLFRITSFAIMLNAMGRTKFIFFSSILALLVNIVLNFALYYFIGFSGPAISTIFSIAATSMFNLVASCKLMKIPFSEIFPWRSLGVIGAINIALGCFVYCLSRQIKLGTTRTDVLVAIFIGICWTCVYILLFYKRIKVVWNRMNHGGK